MRHIKRLIGIVVPMALVGFAASGCVDQENSLKLRGVVAPGGSIEEEDIDCSEGDEEDNTISQPNLSCSGDVSPGSASEFFSSLSMDVSAFERNPADDKFGGQPGGDNGAYISDEEFCGFDSPPITYQNLKFRHPQFFVTFDAVNQLEDSREVGAEGEGGGSGGFGGLKLDQNDIETESLKFRFPGLPDGEAERLERDIPFTMIVDSGEGAIAPSIDLFDQGDVSVLRDIHESVVTRRTDSGSYDTTAEQTVVTITAEMWIDGETVSGKSVESNRLNFPIRLCGQGCGVTPRCVVSSD